MNFKLIVLLLIWKVDRLPSYADHIPGRPAPLRQRKIDFHYSGGTPDLSYARSSKLIFQQEYVFPRHKRELNSINRMKRAGWSSWDDWSSDSWSPWDDWSSNSWSSWDDWSSNTWSAWDDWSSNTWSAWDDWSSNEWSSWKTWSSDGSSGSTGLVVGVVVAVLIVMFFVICCICVVCKKYQQNLANVENRVPAATRAQYVSGQTVSNNPYVTATNFVPPPSGYGAPVPPVSYNFPNGPQATEITQWAPPESQTAHVPHQQSYPPGPSAPVNSSAPVEPSAPGNPSARTDPMATTASLAPPPNYFEVVKGDHYAVARDQASVGQSNAPQPSESLELPTYSEYRRASNEHLYSSSDD